MILTRKKKLFILKRHRLTDFFINMSVVCSLCLILCQFFFCVFISSLSWYIFVFPFFDSFVKQIFHLIIRGYDNNEHQQQEYLIVKGFFSSLCALSILLFSQSIFKSTEEHLVADFSFFFLTYAGSFTFFSHNK